MREALTVMQDSYNLLAQMSTREKGPWPSALSRGVAPPSESIHQPGGPDSGRWSEEVTRRLLTQSPCRGRCEERIRFARCRRRTSRPARAQRRIGARHRGAARRRFGQYGSRTAEAFRHVGSPRVGICEPDRLARACDTPYSPECAGYDVVDAQLAAGECDDSASVELCL
jgi:hypothetical protein